LSALASSWARTTTCRARSVKRSNKWVLSSVGNLIVAQPAAGVSSPLRGAYEPADRTPPTIRKACEAHPKVLEAAAHRVQDRGGVRLIFVPLAAAGFAFGLATAATKLIKAEPTFTPAPTSIVWADRVYSTKHDLSAWLKSRGATYEVWSARHPGDAQILERSGPPTPTAPAAPSAPARQTGSAPSQSDHMTLAIGVVIGSLLGLIALLTAVRFRRLQFAGRTQSVPASRRLTLRRRRAGLVPRSVIARLGAGWRSSSRGAWAGLSATVAASRGAWAELEARVGTRHRIDGGAGTVEYAAALSSQAIRRHVPEIAWCLTVLLLALVIGASIALYLK
jgi:hypothetical protein